MQMNKTGMEFQKVITIYGQAEGVGQWLFCGPFRG